MGRDTLLDTSHMALTVVDIQQQGLWASWIVVRWDTSRAAIGSDRGMRTLLLQPESMAPGTKREGQRKSSKVQQIEMKQVSFERQKPKRPMTTTEVSLNPSRHLFGNHCHVLEFGDLTEGQLEQTKA